MKTQAPRWSTIMLAAPRTYSAQPVGIKTGDRVYKALPVDSLHRSPVQAEPVMAVSARDVTVKPGDVLALKAQKGDYYWKIARRFAKEDALGAYAKELIARNGGSSAIKQGQLLNLPVSANSDYELELAIAVQKVVQLRSLFSSRMPELDWGSVEVGPGPVDSYWVSFREASSQERRRFLVADDLSGLYPGRYTVWTEREAREFFPL